MFLPILGLSIIFMMILLHVFKPNTYNQLETGYTSFKSCKANPFYYFGVSMKKKKHNMLRISKLKRK